MADYTKTQGQLMDWTTLDDTGGVPSLESPALDSGEALDSSIEAHFHIDVCHQDANDASTNNVEVVVWGKSGTTDEDWHEIARLAATGGTANGQILAAASGSGQANADRIEVAATANFQDPGDVYFLKDAGVLANSCIVLNKDYVSNDYVEAMDDLANAYDTADYLYDIVDQFTITLPSSLQAARVTFHNPDGDATYACRIRYTLVTAMA
jgi:hypothetical protein